MAENLIHSIDIGNTQYEIANDNRYYTETEIDSKLSGASNRNLLRNWYFADPVNSRGQTTYDVSGYCIDGWKAGANTTVVLEDTGITLSRNDIDSGGTRFTKQFFENAEDYLGKEMTLSVLFSDGTFKTSTATPQRPTGSDTSYSPRCLAPDGANYVAFCTPPTGAPSLGIRLGKNAIVSITAMKLEFGSTQTLAHLDENGVWVLNDPVPDKYKEYLRCMCSTADADDIYANEIIYHSGNLVDWFKQGINIPANSSLNNYTTPGKYYATYNSSQTITYTGEDGTEIVGPLPNDGYTLFVFTREGSAINQLIIGYAGGIYFRGCNTSGLLKTEWTKYLNEATFNAHAAVQNIKHYSTVGQLGLTSADAYLDVIVNAMPTHSVFQMSISDNTVRYDEASGKTQWNCPSSLGTLRIVKVSSTRCYAEFTAHKSSSHWLGTIYNNDGTLTFYGWEKVPKHSEINALVEEKYSAAVDYTDTNYVPITRKVNNKALNADITLTPADVGALRVYNSMEQLGTTWENCTPSIIFNAMETPSILMVRSPNNFPLGDQNDFVLPSGMESLTVMKFNSINATFHADDINNNNAGYTGVYDNNRWYGWKAPVPETRTINNKALSSNITLSASDVGALKQDPPFIELWPGATAGHGGVLDFHYNNSTNDYTSRIIESESGTLLINGVSLNSGTVTGNLNGNATSATKAIRPNRNLLRNWYWKDPVNSRKKTSYTEKAQYTIDGWYSSSATGVVSLGENGLAITGGTTTSWFRQYLENVEEYLGKELTLSVLTSDGQFYTNTATPSRHTSSGSTRYAPRCPGSGSLPNSTNGSCYFAFVAPYSGDLSISFRIAANSTINIAAVKLEFGPTQTLAYQDANGVWQLCDPIPDKHEEYLKCIQCSASKENGYASHTLVPYIGEALDYNNIKTPQFFYGTTETKNYGEGTGSRVAGFSVAYKGAGSSGNTTGENEVTQILFRNIDGGLYNTKMRQYDRRGVWHEYWINPLMDNGIEYRTLEFYNGRPVYAMIVYGYVGDMSPNSTKTIAFRPPVRMPDDTVYPEGQEVADGYTRYTGMDYMISANLLSRIGEYKSYIGMVGNGGVDGIEYAYVTNLGHATDDDVNSGFAGGGELTIKLGGTRVVDHVYVLVKYTKKYFDLQTCCFEPGTQVLVSLDGKTKSIEDIQAGDAVVSYDVNTDSNYLAEVTKLITNENSIDMARVEFDNGVMIKMTDYHPLYTKEGWSSISDKNYRQLKVGDEVKTVDGWSKVTRIILYQNSEFMTTYTLAIRDYGEDPDNDDNDNFYANGMLAHNVRCT